MQGKRKKKRPCDKFVTTGVCKFGDRCKFSHDVSDLTKRADGDEVKQDATAGQHNGHGEDSEQKIDRDDEASITREGQDDAVLAVQ